MGCVIILTKLRESNVFSGVCLFIVGGVSLVPSRGEYAWSEVGPSQGVGRVATAQGKQGIWFLLFPDRENTGNFALTQGKILRHRENIFL